MTEAKPAVIHTEPADRWEPQRKPRGNNEEVIRQWPGKNNAKMIWTKFASENCLVPGEKPEEHSRTDCSATAGSGQEGEPKCQKEEIRGLNVSTAGGHSSFLVREEKLPGKPLAADWSPAAV